MQPEAMIEDLNLSVVREAAPGVYLLQAAGARTALAAASALSSQPGVISALPVWRPPLAPSHAYATQPNDTYFPLQWHLENRATNGARLGSDLNARAAWAHQNGSNVVIAIVDGGVDLQHAELVNAVAGMPHFNFFWGSTNAGPNNPLAYHGTAIAGLAAARGRNQSGVSGVARNASLASWSIFEFSFSASSSQLADMFQHASNTVAVQNHSWATQPPIQYGPQLIEKIALSNAFHFGRDGRGVVMVRAAGNFRADLVNANDDGYANDPRLITVGGVRSDGQVTSFSSAGACLLLAAPIGDPAAGDPGLLTTDLTGSSGLNGFGGSNDYTYISGTSAAAPLVAGIAALALEANPGLTYRDVQQLLLLSARQSDLTDPDLRTNQAGLLVSHNTGFGVPDAGEAVRLARNWPLRPAVTNLVVVNDVTNQIPNQGLLLQLYGDSPPPQLASFPAAPAAGQQPADLSPFLPVVDVGTAAQPITTDLTNSVALILRGTNSYAQQIQYAADAGARMAVIANHPNDGTFVLMTNTHRSPIPAFFIRGPDGTALRNYVATNSTAQLRNIVFRAVITNEITTPLLVEHVSVRIKTDHFGRGDLRVLLESPSGLRSELQHPNKDETGNLLDWTYSTTHHFYESSQGVWSILVSDEKDFPFGNVQYTELIIRGVPVTDQDRDGLDDDWELQHFNTLASQPHEDADFDGESNMREFVTGTDPLSGVEMLQLDASPWSPELLRLDWSRRPGRTYDILGATNVPGVFNVLTNLPTGPGGGEWFVPLTPPNERFFQLRSRAAW